MSINWQQRPLLWQHFSQPQCLYLAAQSSLSQETSAPTSSMPVDDAGHVLQVTKQSAADDAELLLAIELNDDHIQLSFLAHAGVAYIAAASWLCSRLTGSCAASWHKLASGTELTDLMQELSQQLQLQAQEQHAVLLLEDCLRDLLARTAQSH